MDHIGFTTGIELGAQVIYVDLYNFNARLVIVTPDTLEDYLFSKDLALVAG
jgi:lactam utilization protein B